MEMISVILFVLFIICFIALFLTAFLMYITRKILKRRLKKNFPEIWYFTFSLEDFFDLSVVGKAFALVFSFGSKEGVRQFNSHYFDIESIEKKNDIKANKILRLLYLWTSSFARLWSICLLLLILIGSLLSIN